MITTKINNIEKYDADGNIISSEVTVNSVNTHKNGEGDYVKIYTDKLNLVKNISGDAFKLLITLCKYMSYADISDLEGGMLIKVDVETREKIQGELNIARSKFYKDFKALKDNNLVKSIKGNTYQINPLIIGKGFFEYRTSYKSGGIKDLREKWDKGLKQEKVYISADGAIAIAGLKAEIKKLARDFKKYNKLGDRESARDCKETINYFTKQLKQLDEREYTKIVKYTVEVNNTKIEEEEHEQEQVQEYVHVQAQIKQEQQEQMEEENTYYAYEYFPQDEREHFTFTAEQEAEFIREYMQD